MEKKLFNLSELRQKSKNTDSIVKSKKKALSRVEREKERFIYKQTYSNRQCSDNKITKKNIEKPTAVINYHFALPCNCFAYESFFRYIQLFFQAQHFGSVFLYISFNSVNVAKNKEEEKSNET